MKFKVIKFKVDKFHVNLTWNCSNTMFSSINIENLVVIMSFWQNEAKGHSDKKTDLLKDHLCNLFN